MSLAGNGIEAVIASLLPSPLQHAHDKPVSMSFKLGLFTLALFGTAKASKDVTATWKTPPALETFSSYEDMQHYFDHRNHRLLRHLDNPLDDTYIAAFNQHNEQESLRTKRSTTSENYTQQELSIKPALIKFEASDAVEPSEEVKELIRQYKSRELQQNEKYLETVPPVFNKQSKTSNKHSARPKRSTKYQQPANFRFQYIPFDESDAREPGVHTKHPVYAAEEGGHGGGDGGGYEQAVAIKYVDPVVAVEGGGYSVDEEAGAGAEEGGAEEGDAGHGGGYAVVPAEGGYAKAIAEAGQKAAAAAVYNLAGAKIAANYGGGKSGGGYGGKAGGKGAGGYDYAFAQEAGKSGDGFGGKHGADVGSVIKIEYHAPAENFKANFKELPEFKQLSSLVGKSPDDQIHGLTYLLAKDMQNRLHLQRQQNYGGEARPKDNKAPVLFHPKIANLGLSGNYKGLAGYKGGSLGAGVKGLGGGGGEAGHNDNGYETAAAKLQSYSSKYAFGYRIRDFSTGNDFGHKQNRDLHGVTRGQYHILLPDGRIQNVIYHADDTGFHADVSFESGR